MSGSISDVAAQPLVPDAVPLPGAPPVLSPQPNGPPTSVSIAALSSSGSTSSTTNPDGSITTTVIDVLGNTLSLSTNAPETDAVAAAQPLVSFEA